MIASDIGQKGAQARLRALALLAARGGKHDTYRKALAQTLEGMGPMEAVALIDALVFFADQLVRFVTRDARADRMDVLLQIERAFDAYLASL